MNIPTEERKRPPDDSPLSEPEVKKLIQAVKEASSPTPVRADGSAKLPGPADEEDPREDAARYWDVSTMAPLNAASAAAIARLRAFKPPPFPLWDRLPVSRRAAVLMLLYADRRGDLRVVITMRAASLRSFSGHAALPGGKADNLEETPYQIARREAWEEIGLPMDDSKIPAPFRIEHLCYLPHSLAKTELAVRPSVAFLHVSDPPVPAAAATTSGSEASTDGPTVEESLIPRLDAREVAAVFSAPFHNFLRADDEPELQRPPLPGGKWYEGSWIRWHDRMWRMHFFYVPVNNQHVSKPRARDGGLAAIAEQADEEEEEDEMKAAEEAGRYKVWGMTARILVDAATVAYGAEPEFEHNGHFGDEEVIEALEKLGRLGEKKRRGSSSAGGDANKTNDTSKM